MISFLKSKNTVAGTLCGLSRHSQKKAQKHAVELKHPIGVVVYYNHNKKQFHTADGRKFTYAIPVPPDILKALVKNQKRVDTASKLRKKYSK